MKKLLAILFLLSISLVNAQVYEGKGDTKFQVGANIQDNASGLFLSYDIGVGENMSVGITSTYSLGINEALELNNADFGDRFDIRARFNANLGNVINIDDNFDVYPGLSLGLKNFGTHLGLRYLFTHGFGVFTELNAPIAKYNDSNSITDKLHNQITVNLGAVFNL